MGALSIHDWFRSPAGMSKRTSKCEIELAMTKIWMWFESCMCLKHKKILERSLPDDLKLSIAKKIENNLFSKVFYLSRLDLKKVSMAVTNRNCRLRFSLDSKLWEKSGPFLQQRSTGTPPSIFFRFLCLNWFCFGVQLLLRSETRYYSQGTIIADSREEARGLIVITSGQVIWIGDICCKFI